MANSSNPFALFFGHDKLVVPSNKLSRTGFTFLLGASSLLLAMACGPAGSAGQGETTDPGSGVGLECVAGEGQCTSGYFQECVDGVFEDVQFCDRSCDKSLGCVQCKPDRGATICDDDAVRACTASGAIGEVIETCSDGMTCSVGQCVSDGGGNKDCDERAELVYVVDNDDNLRSFDPRLLDEGKNPFTLIGEMDCPAGPSWPDWGSRVPSPFSMSVDRDANAWVLYTSGEIFHVSTEDASCQSTSFSKGQEDFELFGMGFVADAPGSSKESLWIAGTTAWDLPDVTGDLGYIDTESLEVTRVGTLPSGPANSPELTGTGDGELFGFYPGSRYYSSRVAMIDKADARHDDGSDWRFTEPGDDVRGWAFAHWGGKFYIFVTTDEWLGDNSQVLLFDPATGDAEPLMDDLPYTIVGAGVSTCAPVVID